MKKTLILTTAFLFVLKLSNAQTEKGSQTLGVDLGYSYSNTNGLVINPYDNSSSGQTIKITGFNVGPLYSYFIANNLEVGAALFYQYNKQTENDPNNPGNPTSITNKNYSAVIYARKYFLFQNKFGFRVGPYVGYGKASSGTEYQPINAVYNYNSSSNAYNAGANLALVYFPSKRLGFTAGLAGLNYNHYNADNGNQGHQSQDSFNFNFVNNGLTLSMFFVFGS